MEENLKNVTNQEGEIEKIDMENDLLIKEVETIAHNIKENAIGYPVNEDVLLDDFYEWFIKNKISKVSMNNVGDPFDQNMKLGIHKVEKAVLKFFGPLYGFKREFTWGLMTQSGTDGNNHGIYFGRKYIQSKGEGNPILYVSTESHYSNKRLADLQQLECKLVPADKMGKMIPEEFERNFDRTKPAIVVFSMGTTFKGAIDDIQAINNIIEKDEHKTIYRHVDAALFGGYLPFSEYAYLLDRRVYVYDSIAISGHKFFGLNDPCGIFLTSKEVLKAQTSFEEKYLNGSMPMINCSRSALTSLKLYWLTKKIGKEGYEKQTKQIFENVKYLKNQFDKISWPNWNGECSNTVFFKRPSEEIMKKYYLAGEYDENFGGELAHIVVMQSLTKEKIDLFIEDLKKDK